MEFILTYPLLCLNFCQLTSGNLVIVWGVEIATNARENSWSQTERRSDMYTVVEMTRDGGIRRALGPVMDLNGQQLKSFLAKEGYVHPFEPVEARKWLTGSNGTSAMILELELDPLRLP